MRGWGAEPNTVDRSEFDPNQAPPPHYRRTSQQQHPQILQHQHPLPPHPGMPRDSSLRHISASSSSGLAGPMGGGPAVGGYQVTGREGRQPGGWTSRSPSYGLQVGRGQGRGGPGGRGRQHGESSRRNFAGDGRSKGEAVGVLHAVELGRIVSGWEEGESTGVSESADHRAVDATGSTSEADAKAYVELTLANDTKESQDSADDTSARPPTTRPVSQHQTNIAEQAWNTHHPAPAEDPVDLWRSDATASRPPTEARFAPSYPHTWDNPHRNTFNSSRSRPPYNGSSRREEYKAGIRSKIESLEDEEKPAFAKAKEKTRVDDGWGATPVGDEERKMEGDPQPKDSEGLIGGQADGWGVAVAEEAGVGSGPMEANSKLFGPASLAAQSLDPGTIKETEGARSSTGHTLHGDVARRIPDAGWGKRGRGARRVSSGRDLRQEDDSGKEPTASPDPVANVVLSVHQADETTPKPSHAPLDLIEPDASVAVEPSERADVTPAPSSPAEIGPQQPATSDYPAHTRLLTIAVNDFRPSVHEVSMQQLKRVGPKQDRADYVADWKRSQAIEARGEDRDWEEKSLSSEGPSRAPSRRGRGATKAPPIMDHNGSPVVVALPQVNKRKPIEGGRKYARDETKCLEGSVGSGMSGYEAQPDENPATIVRGTSFDGIWDSVPIDPSEEDAVKDGDLGPATVETNMTGTKRSPRSENKIVVRLPTPKSSPLPSLAGSDHVPSPFIQIAVLEHDEPISQIPALTEDVRISPDLIQSVLGLQTFDIPPQMPPKDTEPSDTVKILAETLQNTTSPTDIHARVASSDTVVPTERPKTYPLSETQKSAVSAPAFIPRSHSSLGSLPLEKVIIPLDDLSDVESASEEIGVRSIRKEIIDLPDVSPVSAYNHAHISPSVLWFKRQPGIRSAVIPERRLPDISPEMLRYSPLAHSNEMLLQQQNNPSRYHNHPNDELVHRKQQAQPGPTKWELKMENLLHNISSRQSHNESNNQEIRLLRQEVASLQQHLQEARHRAYASQSAVAEKQSHLEQLSTRIGESARTAQMYEGSLAARNADLAYCRGRIEHLESILLANQKFIADLQIKVSEATQPKKGSDKAEDRTRSTLERIVELQRQSLDQGKKTELNLADSVRKLQVTLEAARREDVDQARQHENQAANLKERGLQLDVREANFLLTQAESERDYYKRLAKDLHDQLKENKSKPRTVFDIDPNQPGFIETTYNSDHPTSSFGHPGEPSRFGMPDTPPKSTLISDLREFTR